MNQEQREALQARVFEKASTDAAYRAKLLANPRDVIVAEYGEGLPEYVKFHAIEEKPNTIVLVVPQLETDELSDDELETVAGGKNDDDIQEDDYKNGRKVLRHIGNAGGHRL
ncbi:MAG: NHLP leader peptide family RiPP precursor [Candidatus Sericytochromatia bacterium]|nr:NHLP leader peptide family RiPP precursor [Candidatus Tanganyikabacteria bacterium]